MISILIPTYNRSELLEKRALKSVFAQIYKDYEVIVIDDCSTDNTAEIIKKYPITYFRNNKNLGKAGSLNKGIDLAKGEYIVFLDDDNELFPEFLERTINKINGYDAVQTGRIINYGPIHKYASPYTGNFYASIDWGWLIKKEVFDKIQYDENMFGDEDADLGIQFAKHFKKINIDEPLQMAYSTEEDDKDSMCIPTERRLKALDYFIKKNIKEYKDKNELRYLYRLAGRNWYKGGYKLKGLNYFWKSFLAMPNLKTFKHLFFILFGWESYNSFMNSYERN